MMATHIICVALTALLISTITSDAFLSRQLRCPEECICYYKRSNWMTDCSNHGLNLIPFKKIDGEAYTLNMNENKMMNIDSFPEKMKLRTILLSDNLLTKIKKTTFSELEYLIDIDLSHNKITHVEKDAFV